MGGYASERFSRKFDAEADLIEKEGGVASKIFWSVPVRHSLTALSGGIAAREFMNDQNDIGASHRPVTCAGNPLSTFGRVARLATSHIVM